MARIKICGMRREQDIKAAKECRPDYIGFILSQGFRRTVRFEDARAMRAQLLEDATVGTGEEIHIEAVGVFVNEPIENVLLAAEGSLEGAGAQPFIDLIQLHGQESEDYIAELRKHTKKPVIKAFKIRSEEDLQAAEKSTADLILLDNGTGTGSTFDWTLLRDLGRPWILAGGLGPDNLEEAVRRFGPYAVDLSSGTETDGWKDPAKMRRCVEIVRQADLE